MKKSDLEALAEFRYQLRRFLRFSEDAAQAEGLTSQQYQLILQIGGFPGRDWAHVNELAERLQSKQHGAVALISRCEAAGLVQRSPDPDDGRQVRVSLTADGRRFLTQLAERHRDELHTLSDVFRIAPYHRL